MDSSNEILIVIFHKTVTKCHKPWLCEIFIESLFVRSTVSSGVNNTKHCFNFCSQNFVVLFKFSLNISGEKKKGYKIQIHYANFFYLKFYYSHKVHYDSLFNEKKYDVECWLAAKSIVYNRSPIVSVVQ